MITSYKQYFGFYLKRSLVLGFMLMAIGLYSLVETKAEVSKSLLALGAFISVIIFIISSKRVSGKFKPIERQLLSKYVPIVLLSYMMGQTLGMLIVTRDEAFDTHAMLVFSIAILFASLSMCVVGYVQIETLRATGIYVDDQDVPVQVKSV